MNVMGCMTVMADRMNHFAEQRLAQRPLLSVHYQKPGFSATLIGAAIITSIASAQTSGYAHLVMVGRREIHHKDIVHIFQFAQESPALATAHTSVQP